MEGTDIQDNALIDCPWAIDRFVVDDSALRAVECSQIDLMKNNNEIAKWQSRCYFEWYREDYSSYSIIWRLTRLNRFIYSFFKKMLALLAYVHFLL